MGECQIHSKTDQIHTCAPMLYSIIIGLSDSKNKWTRVLCIWVFVRLTIFSASHSFSDFGNIFRKIYDASMLFSSPNHGGRGGISPDNLQTPKPEKCVERKLKHVFITFLAFTNQKYFCVWKKYFRYGRQPPPEPTSPIAFNVAGNEVGHHHHHHHESFSGSRSGQILWIRGLTRLQTQVGQFCSCFYSLFRPISLFIFFYLSLSLSSLLSLLSTSDTYDHIWSWFYSLSRF